MAERDISRVMSFCIRRIDALLERRAGPNVSIISIWRIGVLAGSFLVSQSSIRLLQAVCGLLLVRWLSIEAFAAFTIAMALLTVARIGADFGLSQALVVLGAPHRGDANRLGSLFSAARRQSIQLMVMTAPIVVALAVLAARANDWPLWNAIVTAGLVLIIGWTQIYGTLGSAILNIYQDVKGLFTFGLAETGVRLAATLGCLVWPHSVLALFAVWLGAVGGRLVIAQRVSGRLSSEVTPAAADGPALRRFVRPLVPGIIYFVVQGQISVFLLGMFGYTQSVAEVGALSRLAQVIALLGTLNLFFVQPHFARLTDRRTFVLRLMLLLFLVFSSSAILVISSYVVPELWLIILGRNYMDLTAQLPLLMLCAVASLVGGTLYSVVISRGVTARQAWAIIPGLCGQILFIAINGVSTTTDALLLNLIPAAGYVLTQAFLLFDTVRKWHRQA